MKNPSEETLEELKPDTVLIRLDCVQPGQVLLTFGGGLISEAISMFSGGPFSHAAVTNDGYLLVSGGGPGAMEATNLGAYFATHTLLELRAAIKRLEDFKEFKSGKSVEWLIPAMKVRRDFPLSPADEPNCLSVGIPTWSYDMNHRIHSRRTLRSILRTVCAKRACSRSPRTA